MKTFSYIVYSTLILAGMLCAAAPPVLAETQFNSDWIQIDVPNNLTVTDPQGATLTLKPACAFSYLNENQTLPFFHFFYRAGTSNNLLVFFNGGGVCWDYNTCIGSFLKPPQGGADLVQIYNSSLSQSNTPVNAGGILDTKRADNPLKDWSMIYIPYCTADMHIGSVDQGYRSIDRVNPINEFQHRGFDNFMAVREWIKQSLANQPGQVQKLLVTGSDAGAYGAKFNFPYLAPLFPQADSYLLADAAAGAFDQSFLDQVFVKGGPWNIENTLAKAVPAFRRFGQYLEPTFNPVIVSGLSHAYPKARIAEYNQAWDNIQAELLQITFDDTPTRAPYLPWSSVPEQNFFLDWNALLKGFIAQTVLPNYRYYLAAGSDHSILTNADSTDLFYTEHSAGGVYFKTWISNFLNNSRNWNNAACTGNCGNPY